MIKILKELFFKEPVKHEYILDLKIPQNRKMFKEARKEFLKTYKAPSYKNKTFIQNIDISVWVEFGKYNYCEVIVDRIIHGFPNIDTLKFQSEDEYNWFLLRWS